MPVAVVIISAAGRIELWIVGLATTVVAVDSKLRNPDRNRYEEAGSRLLAISQLDIGIDMAIDGDPPRIVSPSSTDSSSSGAFPRPDERIMGPRGVGV